MLFLHEHWHKNSQKYSCQAAYCIGDLDACRTPPAILFGLVAFTAILVGSVAFITAM